MQAAGWGTAAYGRPSPHLPPEPLPPDCSLRGRRGAAEGKGEVQPGVTALLLRLPSPPVRRQGRMAAATWRAASRCCAPPSGATWSPTRRGSRRRQQLRRGGGRGSAAAPVTRGLRGLLPSRRSLPPPCLYYFVFRSPFAFWCPLRAGPRRLLIPRSRRPAAAAALLCSCFTDKTDRLTFPTNFKGLHSRKQQATPRELYQCCAAQGEKGERERIPARVPRKGSAILRDTKSTNGATGQTKNCCR